jgi:hypothetical protein
VSAFLPNTYVTILDAPDGATDTDYLGDAVADWATSAEHVPGFWAQKDQRTWDPVSQRVTIIRGYLVRLRPGTAVTENQRVLNERTGELGQVNQVDRKRTLGTAGDVELRVVAIDR